MVRNEGNHSLEKCAVNNTRTFKEFAYYTIRNMYMYGIRYGM